MIEWKDRAIVLGTRPFREKDCILDVFTALHGRHRGLVFRGSTPRLRQLLQPSNLVEVRWSARLEPQLGRFHVEKQMIIAGRMLRSESGLAMAAAMTSLLATCLPDRDPNEHFFNYCSLTMERIPFDSNILNYGHWELNLLKTLGHGIEIGEAYLQGPNDFPAFVSPRTGRVVGYAAAESWRNRLWPLPKVIAEQRSPINRGELREILKITELVLLQHVMEAKHPQLPHGARMLRRMVQMVR